MAVTKDLLRSDLRHIGRAFISVYPMAFRRIISHWGFTLLALFAIVTSFWFDETVRQFITGLNGNIIETLAGFGRWYGNGMPTLYLFLGLYILGLIFKQYKMREAGLLVAEAYIFSGLITLFLFMGLRDLVLFVRRNEMKFYVI